MLLSQRTPSLEKEKDAVVQFLTHIQVFQTLLFAISTMHSLSLSLPLGERHTPRNVDAFFLKIDCWDQAVLLVCAWEKEDLPERRPKMKEMVSRMREHFSVTHKEEW